MEFLDRSIAIADELKHEINMEDACTSPRLQRSTVEQFLSIEVCSCRCVSEIVPLFAKLKTFRSPWGHNTLCALKKLLEALESTNALIHVTHDAEVKSWISLKMTSCCFAGF